MDNSFIADVKRIFEASQKEKLVVFVGAGVSRNSGVLDWGGLIDQLKEELPKEVSSDNDYLKVAQLHKDERGTNDYIKKIRLELKHGEIAYNGINEAIFDLDPIHVITTNYDDLLEQVIDSNNLQYYKVCQDRNLPYSDYNRYLVKMHGDLEEGNIVLTEDDYINYENNFPLTSAFIRSLFATRLILFVGFSFNDYNLKVILSKVKNLLGEDFQMMYLLQTDTAHYIQKEYLKKRGIKIVEYNPVIKTLTLKVLNKLEQSSLEGLKDERGKKLFLLLKYIQKYEGIRLKFADPYELVNIIYDLIKKYSDQLYIIRGDKVAKFLEISGIESRYEDFTLSFSLESYENLSNYLKTSISNKRKFIETSIQKLRVIQHYLSVNQIFYLQRLSSVTSTNIPFRKFIKKEDERSKGISLLYDMDLKNLLSYITELRRRDTQNITINDLELPYLLYKIGRCSEAYNIYVDLSTKCWQMKNYILFFLCQYNIKRLKLPLENEALFQQSVFTFADLELIKDKIEKINLDKILTYLSIENKAVVSTLEDLSKFDHVNKVVYDIINLVTDVREAKRSAEYGGYNSRNYSASIHNKALYLWNFCNYNYLVSDFFSEHQYIYLQGFEGLVISNNINRNGNSKSVFGSTPRLEEIDRNHLLLILYLPKHENLTKVFSSNKIKEIILSEDAKQLLIDSVKNLVGYDTFFFKNNTFFDNYIIRFSSNFLVIVSKCRTDDKFTTTAFNLLNHLSKVSPQILQKLSEPISYFFNNCENLIVKRLEELLNNIFKFSPFNYSILKIVDLLVLKAANISGENNYKIKVDKTLLLGKIEPALNDSYLFSNIAFLYQFLEEDQQEYLKQYVKSKLDYFYNSQKNDRGFNDYFIYSSYYGIFTSEEYELKFVNKIYENINRGFKSSHETFDMNVLDKIFKHTKNLTIKRKIKAIAKVEPKLSFLINPKDFDDFSSFDIKWFRSYTIDEFKTLFSDKESFKKRLKELISQYPEDKGLIKIYTYLY